MLLIDIGNTRIKWARLDGSTLSEMSALPHADLDAAQVRQALLESAPRANRVVASNVAGPRIGDLVSACIRDAWRLDVEYVRTQAATAGVRNGYRDPTKLGVDRWMAVVGAWSMQHRAACVVSVGTAMTVDVVDASGLHHGGLITPGPELMVATLFRNTSDIARHAQQGESNPSLFADNTRGAVEQGAMHALAALVDRAVAAFAAQVGGAPALMLTGGAADRIVAAIRTPHVLLPDLVLRGLAVAASGH